MGARVCHHPKQQTMIIDDLKVKCHKIFVLLLCSQPSGFLVKTNFRNWLCICKDNGNDNCLTLGAGWDSAESS